MLEFGKIINAGYYMEPQAEYYLNGCDPTGIWWNLPAYFGYADGANVDPYYFKKLFAGFSPRDDQPLVRNAGQATKRGGYDLTFSADKSISALWAVAPAEMRSEIEAGQMAAVRAALVLVQEKAGEARRGKDGTVREPVALFGSLFQHGESKAGDPDLHTHALVFNCARGPDTSWGSIASEKMFLWKMAIGALYRAAMAEQLQSRLGLVIEKHGARREFIRIQGVPASVCDAWSKRHRTILGLDDTQAPDDGHGAREVQSGSDFLLNAEERHARWRAEAAPFSWGPEQASMLAPRGMRSPHADREQVWHRLNATIREQLRHRPTLLEQEIWTLTAVMTAGLLPSSDIWAFARRLQEEVMVRSGQDSKGRAVYRACEGGMAF